MIEEALRTLILASLAGPVLTGGVWLNERPALPVTIDGRQPPSAVIRRIGARTFPGHNGGAQMREGRFQIDVYAFEPRPAIVTAAFDNGGTFDNGAIWAEHFDPFTGAPETLASRLARGIEQTLHAYKGAPVPGVRIHSAWLDSRRDNRDGAVQSPSALASADYLIFFTEAALIAA